MGGRHLFYPVSDWCALRVDQVSKATVERIGPTNMHTSSRWVVRFYEEIDREAHPIATSMSHKTETEAIEQLKEFIRLTNQGLL